MGGGRLEGDGSDDWNVLLAAETQDEAVDEEAMWTGDSRIGRILATFMRSGMESGRDRQGGHSGE